MTRHAVVLVTQQRGIKIKLRIIIFQLFLLTQQSLWQGLSGQNCRLVKLEKPASFDCFSEVECKDRCSLVEEKVCSAKKEEKCSVVPKRQCKTHQEKACNTFSKKVCDTVYQRDCQTGM